MKTINVQPLTRDAFAPFGEFYGMDTPDGYPLCGAIHKFYPDRMTTSCEKRLAFSPLVVKKPDRMIITQQEYHTTAEELLLPLDDDVILHVAPASGGALVTDEVRAFLVPKNTLVKLKAAIWHLAPLPAQKDSVTVMVILPECTYCNDCTVVDLPEAEQFEIMG